MVAELLDHTFRCSPKGWGFAEFRQRVLDTLLVMAVADAKYARLLREVEAGFPAWAGRLELEAYQGLD